MVFDNSSAMHITTVPQARMGATTDGRVLRHLSVFHYPTDHALESKTATIKTGGF